MLLWNVVVLVRRFGVGMVVRWTSVFILLCWLLMSVSASHVCLKLVSLICVEVMLLWIVVIVLSVMMF